MELSELRPTRLETDISAIDENLKLLTAKLPGDVRWMAVIKADAYGHGAAWVLRAAMRRGAWGGAIAMPEEGVTLREAGFTCPLLVLGMTDRHCAEAVLEYDLSQAAYDMESLRLLAEAAGTRGTPAKIHIKLDTGMGRIGFTDEAELDSALEYISQNRRLFKVEGVFSHFARADEPGDPSAEEYTRYQSERFNKMCALISRHGHNPLRHICNSAGMLAYPESDMDMVRIGVSMYGFSEFIGGLRYAQRWVTRALFKKRVEPGAHIGYGGTFVAPDEREILTVPVGYADGYMRAFGNRADVLVRGRRARVVGRVCMDQIMVDVTGIPGADVGDEIVLMGAQGDERITPAELAEIAGTIPYEIMLAPSARVPRICL